MRRADQILIANWKRRSGTLAGLSPTLPTASSGSGLLRFKRLLILPALGIFFAAAVSCAAGGAFSPVGAQDSSEPGRVTVPDDISSLDSEEVERRLGRLLTGEMTAGQTAPGIEPTQEQGEPSVEDLLALLNSASPLLDGSEITIEISPQTLSGLENPILMIKSPAKHGTATVISPNRIIYLPDGSGDGSDTFEYELRDGDQTVVSQVMEIKS